MVCVADEFERVARRLLEALGLGGLERFDGIEVAGQAFQVLAQLLALAASHAVVREHDDLAVEF